MRIQYQENPTKLVYIWLSREEGQDKALLDSLGPQYAAWRADSYMPIVMESGKGDLEHGMYLLMKHHYEKIAKRQLSGEKSLWLFGMQLCILYILKFHYPLDSVNEIWYNIDVKIKHKNNNIDEMKIFVYKKWIGDKLSPLEN